MDSSGVQQFVLTWNNYVKYWESGTWGGQGFSQVPEMVTAVFYNISVEVIDSLIYMTYSPTKPTRGVIALTGGYQQSDLLEGNKWNLYWSQHRDQCTVYGVCGAVGTCSSNNIKLCSCPKGFQPRDNRSWSLGEWWSSGCVRQRPLNCEPKMVNTDEFIDLGVTISADYDFSFASPAKKDCEKVCLLNCSCTAFTFSGNPSSGTCLIWSGDLLNMQRASPSQSNANVFVRVPASTHLGFDRPSSSKRKIISIVGAVLGTAVAVVMVLGIIRISMLRKQRLTIMKRYADSSDSFLRMFSYKELKIATRNFRSKLGSGGFGTVFKGCLADGALVAVKKMNASRQDEKQFRAEISTLGSIQHVNLVRLRGFCAEGKKRLLVYDCMPNGSLNSLLFKSKGKAHVKTLDWKTFRLS